MKKLVKDFLYKKESYLIKGACFEVSVSILTLFILGFFFGGLTIHAQQSTSPHLFVNPAKIELEVKRGEKIENFVRIGNKSDVAIPIEAIVLNFTAEERTGTMQFYAQTQEVLERGIDDISFNSSKWIKIKNPGFILDPGEIEEVNFSIQIPENAEPGGHYAVIIFEPKLPSFYFEEEAFKVIPKIGVLLLFSVEIEGLTRTKEPLTIVEFAIPENLHLKKLENLVISLTGIISEARAAEESPFSIVETSHLPFTLQIKNNDIYHQKPKGNLVITTGNGKIAGKTEIKETTILPGKTRNFPVEFKPNLPEKIEKYLPDSLSQFISKNLLFGKYQANLSLTTKDGIDIIEESIEFWAFPWKVILSTVIALCLFMFLAVKYRKRVSKAIFVLFKK